MSEVDPTLVSLFNEAADAGRQGQPEVALSLYERARMHCARNDFASTDEFVATVHMRIAFCLMDQERYEEAIDSFVAAKPLIHALDHAGRYEFYFAYGNTLGNLRRLDDAFLALVNAISEAESMDDYTGRPATCWSWILRHAVRAEDWSFAAAKAEIALNTARLRGMEALSQEATACLVHARSKLD